MKLKYTKSYFDKAFSNIDTSKMTIHQILSFAKDNNIDMPSSIYAYTKKYNIPYMQYIKTPNNSKLVYSVMGEYISKGSIEDIDDSLIDEFKKAYEIKY